MRTKRWQTGSIDFNLYGQIPIIYLMVSVGSAPICSRKASTRAVRAAHSDLAAFLEREYPAYLVGQTGKESFADCSFDQWRQARLLTIACYQFSDLGGFLASIEPRNGFCAALFRSSRMPKFGRVKGFYGEVFCFEFPGKLCRGNRFALRLSPAARIAFDYLTWCKAAGFFIVIDMLVSMKTTSYR